MSNTDLNKNSFINRIIGSSEKFSLEHRIFNAACLTVVMAGVLSTIVNFSLGLDLKLSVPVFVIAILYFITYYISIKKGIYKILVWPFITFGLVLMGYLWFVNGGINGTVGYFILIAFMVFFSITRKGNRKYAALSVIVLFTMVFYIEYKYPELVIPYENYRARIMDIYFSSVIILMVLGLLTGVILNSYDEERRRVLRQRDEIANKSKQLEATQYELEVHKQNLEKLVEERTRELQNETDKHKKTAEELLQSEEMLRNIFESSVTGIIRISLSGEILYCNVAARKMFGVPLDQEIHKVNFFDKMVSGEFADLTNVERTKQFPGVRKLELIRENEEIFPAECFVGLAKAEKLEDSCFILTIVDISKRVEVEKELIAAKEKAEESDKLKSAFLSNMSHEIRTPMNAILGFSNLLRKKDLSEMAKKEYLSIIDEKGKLLLNIINDIIDFSKVEAGEIKITEANVSLDKIMQELYYTFSEAKRKRGKDKVELRYKFEVGTKNTLVRTDPLRFKQIMTILLDNAIKFTDKGYVEFGFRILKSYSDKTVECFVKDSGIGISEENQEIVFNRFRKIEDIGNKFYDGTGLGLAISQKLANLMNTEIQLKSKKGSGSRFSFNVPVAESDTLDTKEVKSTISDSNPDWNKKKILIADDEITSILLLKEYLQPAGIEVISARNGKEAIDALENGLAPDIILMDLRMPVIDGYTATSIIKKKYPELKIIAQSAYVMPEDEDKARASGCDDFISKPISREAIFEKLTLYL